MRSVLDFYLPISDISLLSYNFQSACNVNDFLTTLKHKVGESRHKSVTALKRWQNLLKRAFELLTL